LVELGEACAVALVPLEPKVEARELEAVEVLDARLLLALLDAVFDSVLVVAIAADPISCTKRNGLLPKSVAQHPRTLKPSFAPAVWLTMTAALQYPQSQKTLVEAANKAPAEQVLKKSQGLLGSQHCA
jgi:hypothetical protein